VRGSKVVAAAACQSRATRIAAIAVGLVSSVAFAASAAPVLAEATASDLTVSIQSDSASAKVGAVLQYHVVVSNRGQIPLAAVAVSVGLDGSRLTPLSASSSSANVICSLGGSYACQIPNLAAGESVYITVMARVAATASGTATSTVVATSAGQSASSAAQTAIDASVRPADLVLALAFSRGGSRGATWTWRVTNRGPGAASATVFDEWGALGTGSISRVSASRGKCAVTGPAYNTANIHCDLGKIGAKTSVTITVYAPSYRQSGISLIEHPSVASPVPDPDPANNGGGNARKVLLRKS